MEIRFVSSLTPEDESKVAKAFIGAVAMLLEPFAIAYTMRIETANNQVFDSHHVPVDIARKPPVAAVENRNVIVAIDRATASAKAES